MNANLNLKKAEQASWKLAAYSDGTADLSLGVVFLLLGVYPFTRELLGPVWNFPLFLAALGGVVALQLMVKRRVTFSRIGIVRLGERFQKRLKVAFLVMVALLILTTLTWLGLGQGITLSFPSWLGGYGMEIIVALIMLAIFWGIAYTLEMGRYYLYGVLLAAIFPLQQLLPVYDGLPSLIAGGIITAVGAVLLARFLRQYPEVSEEE